MRKLAWLGIALMGMGCGGSAKARLELSNQTGAVSQASTSKSIAPRTIAIGAAPTRFAMRLSSVYIVTDVDPVTQNNVGTVSRIWTSPHCEGQSCDLFDFARPSDVVNADLNSQDHEVEPGTYRYVRMEFCQGGPSGPNVEWQLPGMAAPKAYTYGGCGITSRAFDPPLDLKEGDSVAVAVEYDLSKASASEALSDSNRPEGNGLTADDGHGIGYSDCTVDAARTTKLCFQMPILTPSAKK